MASEASSGQIPSSNLLQGSQAIDLAGNQPSGKALPTAGNSAPLDTGATGLAGAKSTAAGTAALTAGTASAGVRAGGSTLPGAQAASTPSERANSSSARTVDPQTMVDILNKNLNDSGRPDEFRLDPSSDALIQQINPSNGEVVGQFSVDEFPALARSVGATGLIVDSRA